MILSERIKKIAECVEYADCIADIGTDHAYLPIALITQKKAGFVIASDLREKPLLRAKRNVEKEGLSDRIELRMSDGARNFKPHEVDAVTISGMGGALMTRIIYERPEVFDELDCMYLSPQSEIYDFRIRLMDMGYYIMDEWMVEEGHKFYFIIKAKAGVEQNPYRECELYYGRELLKKRDETLLRYIKHETEIQQRLLDKLMPIDNDSKFDRISEISAKQNIITEAIGYYYI